MREETRVAVQACLEALDTRYTPEESDRASCPPYPFPDRVIRHHDVVLAEVERLRREGRTDRTCTRANWEKQPQPWESRANLLRDAHLSSFFGDALRLLFAAGDLSAAEFEAVIAQVPDDVTRNHLRGQLVHVLLADGHVADAERVSDTFEDFHGQDQRFFGHRRVARWFAQRGDAAEFFARWSRLAAGRERHDMGGLKETLVESVARVHGWRAAITVAGDKRLGPAYRRFAFTPLAENGEVERLCELFSFPEGTDLLGELDQLQVLAAALTTKAQRTGVATREPFARVLHRIIAVDPSQKQAMRVRDWMMFRLWPAYPDADTLALARKSVRTPDLRHELKALHPAIARPDEGG
jgi:hypothetical protein